MSGMISVKDLEQLAKENIPYDSYKYFAYGAGEETTLKENLEAFHRWKIVPQYLRGIDCFNCNTSTQILGNTISLPICASPTGFHKVGHCNGELETAKGCLAAGTCMAVSSYSSYSHEDIANAVPSSLRWLQMYIFKDRDLTKEFVRRAECFDYKALVITVDTDPLSLTPGTKNAMKTPDQIAANFGSHAGDIGVLIEPCLRWSDVAWLRSETKLPIVLKGIMSKSDAKMALSYGVNGIIVSNKGGRKLDVLPSTLDVLPGIVEEINNRAEVYIDGGIRNGADVFKALALGARAVFLGRPVIWGLIHNGSKGVESVFEMMQEELKIIMANTGCEKISDIDKTMLMRHSVCNCKL